MKEIFEFYMERSNKLTGPYTVISGVINDIVDRMNLIIDVLGYYIDDSEKMRATHSSTCQFITAQLHTISKLTGFDMYSLSIVKKGSSATKNYYSLEITREENINNSENSIINKICCLIRNELLNVPMSDRTFNFIYSFINMTLHQVFQTTNITVDDILKSGDFKVVYSLKNKTNMFVPYDSDDSKNKKILKQKDGII